MKINKLSTFIPAFLSEKPIYAGLSTPILFPAELFLSNTTTFIKSLEIDFGDKIKRNFVFGETHNITFASAGTKTIRIVAKFSNGTEKTVLTYLKVVDASALRVIASVPPCYTQTVNATIPFTPYEPEPLSNINGRLEAGYYFASGTLCNVSQPPLRKPVLILDGFDAGDERGIAKIYSEELVYNGIDNNFGEELRAQGYDVIIVNFPKYYLGTVIIQTGFGSFPFPVYRDGGADYIERNAMAVVKLIQNTNIELFLNGSTENLVIVGPSMGGLISRYALAYMEKQALLNPSDPWLNHNTRLWVSFDSPHNGATIPIGSQKLLEKLGSAEDAVGSPATKQLLLMHYTSPIDKESWYRNVFKANLASNGLAGSDGFPKNLRKIALINGQLQGIQKYPGTTGDYMNIRLKKGILAYIPPFTLTAILVPGAELFTYFAPANNNVGVVHTTQLYFLGFIGLQAGNTNAFAYDGNGSIDKAPGGHYNSSQKVLDGFKKKGIANVAEISGNVSYPDLCFIPSKSALAYKGTNTNLYQNLSGTNLICSGETPFDNYFVPNQDEKHVSISTASAAWLFAELNGTPQYTMPLPPPANFSVNIVTDPTNVACFNTLHYYSIDLNSLPIPARDIVAINWTTTGDWVIDPSTPNGSSNSTNIAISNYYNSGVGTLRVEVITRNICLGFGVGTKQVQIIRPPDYGINIVPVTSAPLCVGIPKIYSFIYTLPPGTGTRTGEFFITSTANVLVIPIPTGIKVVATDNGPTSISIEIKHFSACSGSNSGIGTLLGVAGTPTYQNFIANNPRFPLIYDACVQPPPSIQFANATSVTLDGDTSPTTTGIINLPSAAGTYIVSASNSCGNTPNLTVYVVEISSCKTMPEIKISPNPANTYLDVANILAGSEVKIYTKMGVLVHSEKSENDKIRLDISKLNTDLYILEAVLPDKVKVRKQIIKE